MSKKDEGKHFLRDIILTVLFILIIYAMGGSPEPGVMPHHVSPLG